MQPDELISRIRAALDDTERIARRAGGVRWRTNRDEDGDAAVYDALNDATVAAFTAVYPECAISMDDDDARHIAHHDPAAVLRRVAALRVIVAVCEQAYRDQGNWLEDGQAQVAEDVLHALARGLGINPEQETP